MGRNRKWEPGPEGKCVQDLGLSQKVDQLTTQHTTSCIHKEQIEICSICTKEGRTDATLVGRGHQGRLHSGGGV